MSRNSAARRSTNIMVSLDETTAAPADVVSVPFDRHAGFERNPEAGYVATDLLDPDPSQPRTDFDPEYISNLAESMGERGMLQPIIVVRNTTTPGRWIIVAGHCRYLAAKQAGLARVPCVRREFADPAEILTIQLVENCVRRNLNPLEQAEAYIRLMEARSWSQQELAGKIHVCKSHVTKVLTIYHSGQYTKAQLASGEITQTEAYQAVIAAAVSKERRPRQSRMSEQTFSVVVDGLEVKFVARARRLNVPENFFIRAIKELAKKHSKD